MGNNCNDCQDPNKPSVNEDAIECCELTPANCVVTSEYQNYFKIGKGKTLTYAINKIASVVKAIGVRVTNLEAFHNYRTYVGILNQSGVIAPGLTDISNQLVGTPTATLGYTSAGKYTLTMTGAFTAGKTFITLGEFDRAWGEQVKAYWVDVNTIAIESGSTTDFVDDDVITNMPIEIKVYD